MSNRMRMVQFTLDDSDSEEPQTLPGVLPLPNKPVLDKFQSGSVTRGLFVGQDDDFDYDYVPAPKIPREASKKERTNIKMLNEIEYPHSE